MSNTDSMALTADELARFNSLYCRATRTEAEDKELAELNSKSSLQEQALEIVADEQIHKAAKQLMPKAEPIHRNLVKAKPKHGHK
jgi:hypothetical protein